MRQKLYLIFNKTTNTNYSFSEKTEAFKKYKEFLNKGHKLKFSYRTLPIDKEV